MNTGSQIYDADNVKETPDFDSSKSKKVFSHIGFALLSMLVVTSVLQIMLFQILNGINSIWNESIALWVATFLPLYIVGFPIAVKILDRIPANAPQDCPADKKLIIRLIPISIAIMYIGNAIGTFFSTLLSGGSAQNSIAVYAFDNSFGAMLFFVILAPILEEFLFRRKLIDRTRRYGERNAILFTAFTFGLFHANFYQFFYAFGLGLVFGYIYMRTGRLRYSVILHMLINLLGAVISPYLITNVERHITDAEIQDLSILTQNEAAMRALIILGVYTLILLVVALVGVILLILRRKKVILLPAEEELPKESRFKTIYLNPGMLLFSGVCIGVMIFLLF